MERLSWKDLATLWLLAICSWPFVDGWYTASLEAHGYKRADILPAALLTLLGLGILALTVETIGRPFRAPRVVRMETRLGTWEWDDERQSYKQADETEEPGPR